jgi:hypothetical protein
LAIRLVAKIDSFRSYATAAAVKSSVPPGPALYGHRVKILTAESAQFMQRLARGNSDWAPDSIFLRRLIGPNAAGMGGSEGFGPIRRDILERRFGGRLSAVDRGVSLADHRTKAFAELALVPGDLVVCRERPQVKAIQRKIALAGAQATLLELWPRSRRPWLTDSYGLGDAYWTLCLDIVDSGISSIDAAASAVRVENR